MRCFDYSQMPESLMSVQIVNQLLRIREYRGKQVALDTVKPEILDALHNQAKRASTEASNRIEGIVTTAVRFKALVEDMATPLTRNEAEIAGYRDVLALVHEQHDYIDVKPNVILQLHRDLMGRTGLAFGGSWKDSDNVIVARHADGSSSVRFRPMPAVQTPMAVEELCATYNEAVRAQRFDSLLLSLRFIFDFVSIHPFNDGNGRMSRLLTVLLLERCGYEVSCYISLEYIIEESRDSYYETLATSSIDWSTGKNDEAPFISYMLWVVERAYRKLFERIGEGNGPVGKAERVAGVFDRCVGKVTKADIRLECPDVSDSTIERELKCLLDAGVIRKVGGGRGTGYVRVG